MQPSEVRARVLADHQVLRGDLEQLEKLASDSREKDAPTEAIIGALREHTERFLSRLHDHMRWEEHYLLPALREADAWGQERAARLVADHREQRELLDFFASRLHDAERPAPVLASDVAGLIDLLRIDMREEEDELLDERVLRDDIVGIEVEAG